MPRYSFKEGDSAGGYWAQLLDNDTPVATVYEPELVEKLVELLNGDDDAS